MYGFGSFTVLIKLLIRHGADRKYLFKVLRILLLSFCTLPIRAWESLKFQSQINKQEIIEPPIFILGHWRSGTTYLHYLMSQDPNLGYISSFQAFAPHFFITGNQTILPFLSKYFPQILTRIISEKRVMDNVKFSLDYPAEEEFALGNISCCSLYHGAFVFPRNIESYFKKYVLFDNDKHKEKKKWKLAYIQVLKKATFSMQGKRLILKNPPNTARIKVLLEMFPDAKFIHIYRNPYIVYNSRIKEYKASTKLFGFQTIEEKELEKKSVEIYQQVMHKFFDDKCLISPGNLVEIKFEDLEHNPIQEIERIYKQLSLSGFDSAKCCFKAYIESQKSYKKNEYELDKQTVDKITSCWGFTIRKWRYETPQNMYHNKP
ncbi:sulfotransferase [Gloeocapsopsis crepidinum LEGE 06123]|uniref:Sulfotransferase n=1 Tax=Gloeocapsopsis crepidinum LEGE 06123 TaxID=588587 RepID=A0ABR9UN68_9CHRO|nr:sulfotransferase [Gloeocapsopsis crepidinum]MBE9189739.1 sulfotransferase [Gloeocapsopsis crepidinum LEGE 06123]